MIEGGIDAKRIKEAKYEEFDEREKDSANGPISVEERNRDEEIDDETGPEMPNPVTSDNVEPSNTPEPKKRNMGSEKNESEYESLTQTMLVLGPVAKLSQI